MNKICLFIILVFLCFTSAFAKDFLDKKESNMLVSSENMALELAEIYIKNVYGNTVSINQMCIRDSRYATGSTKTEKASNKSTTFTATKSES